MNTCIVPGGNHSTDLVSVYHGMTEPATACGYHAYYWPELVAQAHRSTECTRSASCEPGDHTYSWPCDYAPGTGTLTEEK